MASARVPTSQLPQTEVGRGQPWVQLQYDVRFRTIRPENHIDTDIADRRREQVSGLQCQPAGTRRQGLGQRRPATQVMKTPVFGQRLRTGFQRHNPSRPAQQ